MIKWISAKTPPKKCNSYTEYLVTIEYLGEGNINNRKTLAMTYEEKERKKIPTWCWFHRASVWEVLFWAELPEPCQNEI